MEKEANITMIEDANGIHRNLINECLTLTIEDIDASVQDFIGKETQQAQNSFQIFHCLTNSMTESAHLKIVAESSRYMDGETPVGEHLFKMMIMKAIIDTRYTANHLQENLTNLDTYMSTVKSNTENLNNYAKVYLDG